MEAATSHIAISPDHSLEGFLGSEGAAQMQNS